MSDTANASNLQLLKRYTRDHAEDAFAELVRLHVDLVHSAALRQVRSPQLAEEVAQSVFADLARNATRLKPDTVLTAWLYQVTRRTAIDVVRREARRQLREQIATEMNAMNATANDWAHIEPLLDEAMSALDESDRAAVLLRYFENKSLREVGVTLGTSDDTAQKRVSRAVERLREFFAKRGVTVGAGGLVVVISTNAVKAAPAGLAFTISSAALASVAAAASGTTLTLLKLMTATKLKLGVVSAVIVAGVLVALLLQQQQNDSIDKDNSAAAPASETAMELARQSSHGASVSSGFSRREPETAAVATPEEIIAGKVSQFGRNRRELVRAIAGRLNKEVPSEIEKFFDAIEAGNWEEIDAIWKTLAKHSGQYEKRDDDSAHWPDLDPFWPSVLDAYGVAEQAHEWPAQQLLDYGNAILDSLRPGMVYVGGTDNGRWVPELLNETRGGEPHIILTQNALADSRYLEFLNTLYSDRLATLTQEDSKHAFHEYTADAQKRLEHDRQFPDEPKQIRPGESIRMEDGRVQVSGQVAVMAVNEKLLQMLMQKNPDLSFAMAESQPLRGMYADAVPLGPLMELGVQDAQNNFTAERAAQSVDYWRTVAQNVLGNPEAAGSLYTLKSYSHDANSAANLLAARNFDTEAEQAYRLSSQIWPGNPEPIGGLAAVLARAGRAEEARQMLDDFARNYPAQRPAIETFRGSILWTAPATPTKPSP